MRFFFCGGCSGDPSCPAMKKLSFGGITKGFEVRVPVNFSPPGERLEINNETLSPSAEGRFSRIQGLVASASLSGELRHTSASELFKLNNSSAKSWPQTRIAGSSVAPRWVTPS